MQRERCECTILEETQRKALLIIPITTLPEITTSMQAAFSPAPPEIDPDRTVETTSSCCSRSSLSSDLEMCCDELIKQQYDTKVAGKIKQKKMLDQHQTCF